MIKKLVVMAAVMFLSACVMEGNRTIETKTTKAMQTRSAYKGPKAYVAIGKFNNSSGYMKGVFSDGVDRVGSKAETVLTAYLQQTGRFAVLDRTNISHMQQERGFDNQRTNIKGAKFVITGDVTEFGRRTTGDKELFGILGKGKKQIAYSKVTINAVDTTTSEVVYSAAGAGEYTLSEREILGFGSKASYDETLTAKVLDLAIREAVDNLTVGIDSGYWQP